jgi:hypothetical protein
MLDGNSEPPMRQTRSTGVLMEWMVALGCVLLALVLLRILNAYWQRKHRQTRPPRHQGEPQSQRGRVYKDQPPTNHNADPFSGSS